MAPKVQKFIDNGDDTFSPTVIASGTVSTTPAAAPSTTVAAVASSATVVTILAANSARKGASVFNDSTAILTLKAGAAASTTSFTTKVAVGGYFEVPFGYTGILTGLWATANGNALVTEYA